MNAAHVKYRQINQSLFKYGKIVSRHFTEGPDPQGATVAKKDSSLRAGNPEQDLAHMGGHSCWWPAG